MTSRKPGDDAFSPALRRVDLGFFPHHQTDKVVMTQMSHAANPPQNVVSGKRVALSNRF
ncbi:MAG: hypothetical protein RIE73_32780 [Coleofasciculus sp. C1-SOL-03]|uniref:hypothetical protein n=1 Tax=Coleofasciculus sp. C1-SOL-03 TaxID=3069522 RepID=UPI0032F77645